MTKNNAFGGEKQNKKSNGEQSDLCDLEQVTLKPQLQVHHYLTTWLQIWYHSLLWGDSTRKGADLERQNCLFGVHPAVVGKLTSLSLSLIDLLLYITSFSRIDAMKPFAVTSCMVNQFSFILSFFEVSITLHTFWGKLPVVFTDIASLEGNPIQTLANAKT